MQIGIVGLGKMGANVARRLLRDEHDVRGFDQSDEVRKELESEGVKTSASLEQMVESLDSPKLIWLLVPSGDVVDKTIEKIRPHLSKGDVLVDGGNSHFCDSMRRYEELKKEDIFYLDVGTSGGIWGLENGFCLMVGGKEEAVEFAEPIFKSLAPEGGYKHVGRSGSGHFVKMIHNGIEYGLMEAYAEGFDLLENSSFDLNLPEIAELWNRGSVIRSWLLELGEKALDNDPQLSELEGFVTDSGMGRWTVNESVASGIPAPTITAALFSRFNSRRQNAFSHRFLAALRNQFGGHAVKPSKK